MGRCVRAAAEIAGDNSPNSLLGVHDFAQSQRVGSHWHHHRGP